MGFSTALIVTQEKGCGKDCYDDDNALLLTSPFNAIIAIGILIKSDTMHLEYIADAVSHGLMNVQLD
jgi:hypothetical protein